MVHHYGFAIAAPMPARTNATPVSSTEYLSEHSRTTRIDHGEEFSVCSACGKERGGRGGGVAGAQREHDWGRAHDVG